jgi:hypothetical protein
MEYFIGSFITIITAILVTKLFSNDIKKPKLSVMHSQSRMYDLIGPILQLLPKEQEVLNTQASKHFDKVNHRILIFDTEAYWIKDNCVYVAEIIDGELDENTTKKVDTMGMNSVQLKKMIFIVDTLTEGKTNDSRDSGN